MKQDPKTMHDWQATLRVAYALITTSLVCAIVMSGFLLLCQGTEPAPGAQPSKESPTVFERAEHGPPNGDADVKPGIRAAH